MLYNKNIRTYILIEGEVMQFESIFAGKMLGDGYINRNRKRARFCFLHSLNDKGYADYCYDLFKPNIPFGSGCTKVEHIKDNRNGKVYSRVYYQSRASGLLDKLYPFWYVDNRKVIPRQYIEEYLDPQGLALWYQDDGCYRHGSNRIFLSTESFTKEERCFLRSLLKRKFHIDSNIDSQNRLDISTRSESRKFLTLVEPYIHPSMQRKSIHEYWNEWKESWQKIDRETNEISRTTIYLPYMLFRIISGNGYSKKINRLLEKWLDQVWQTLSNAHSSLYDFIIQNQPVHKGNYTITPRFRSDINKKLDILSQVTGFEKSELTILALESVAHKIHSPFPPFYG